MYADPLSILRTNDFRCVFRYYYGVNANTALDCWARGPVWGCPVVWETTIDKSRDAGRYLHVRPYLSEFFPKKMLANRLLEILVLIICKQY